ncbi:hypothetical protein ONA91_29715 [Micromonospora sp. DR5-3]|uniref:hypothetical protein n=1 Tax=unclassified Micromonospora TaxID=2617518 RepID=UPI0011D9D167|nr:MULTISPECIES: hypothetical protein [unclassified Micromonospora]MCW3818624.1 hypothetical protein [Micromonospora sp. DR5-3]TYC19785.1 hypothetical protein FXF52_34835 [Micromonospora sp. MP36]
MSDYLRDVDWESLQGPYGPASDVPRLLQTLRSQDPAARGEAEEQLEDHLQHQGLVEEPAAAAAPYLIDLLADQEAPDRLVAYRLLRTILDCVELHESPRPASDVPSLSELASQRSDWWLSRSPEWRKHGGYRRPVTDPCHAAAYEAVRAGVPTYLQVLRDPDPDLRLGMAYLLAPFPQEWATMSPVLTQRLSVEADPAVAAEMCIAAGLAGQPSDGAIVDAVRRWRGNSDRILHRAALIGLVRLLPAPDTALLAELSDCLMEPVQDWGSPAGAMANVTASALGGLTGNSVPQLAGLLLERMRVPDPHRPDFLALRLLLGLTFPDGPLPDGTAFDGLSLLQQEVVRVVIHARLLRQGPMMPRAIGECNLPYTEEALATWCAGQPHRAS